MSETDIHSIIAMLDHANHAFALCSSPDRVCYQSVVLAKQSLGLDRAGVLLFSEDRQQVLGTWGTNERGDIIEEKDLALSPDENHWMQAAIDSKGALVIREDIDLTFYKRRVGAGWNAVVSLWDENQPFGWFCVDNLLTGAKLSELQKGQIVLLGSLLAQWYKRREAEQKWLNLQKTLEHTVQSKTEQLQRTIAELTQTRHELVLQEKAKALSYFTAGVAHEINNPLSYIRSNLFFIGKASTQLIQLLGSREQGSLDNELNLLKSFDEAIDESVSGLDRVTDIVKMLQPLNKLIDEQPQVIDLVAAVEFLTMSLEHSEKIKFIKPIMPVLVKLPLQVITLALESLLNNALYAISNKANGWVAIYLYMSSEHFTITVLDNGEGIAPETLANIFHPFYSTKPVGVGVGLGLSISENLLRLVNGDLAVNSELNRYTFATIKFPIEVLCDD